MKGYFGYSVELWDDDINQVVIEQGVTYGDTYNEALDNVLEYYNSDNIIQVSLDAWDCEGVISMTAEVLRSLREDNI